MPSGDVRVGVFIGNIVVECNDSSEGSVVMVEIQWGSGGYGI